MSRLAHLGELELAVGQRLVVADIQSGNQPPVELAIVSLRLEGSPAVLLRVIVVEALVDANVRGQLGPAPPTSPPPEHRLRHRPRGPST